jgi:NRPS condensation-like uncharacterized protein
MQRQLTGFEKAFCLSKPLVPINFSIVACFSESVDEKALQQTLNKLRPRYPMAFVRLTRDLNGKDYFDSSNIPDIQLKVLSSTRENDWQKLAALDLAENFDLSLGPLIRATLIHPAHQNKETPGDQLLLTFHHGIADGMSAIFFLNDLISWMHDPLTLLPEMQNPPDLLSLISEKSVNSSSVKTQIMGMRCGLWLIKRLSDLGIHFTSADRLIDDRFPWQHICLTSRYLTEDQTTRLGIRCKEEGASIYAAICAAWLMARLQILPESVKQNSISCPVNLRPYLNIENVFGMYMSNTILQAACGPAQTIWEIACEIQTNLKENIDTGKVYEWALTMIGLMASDSDSLPLAMPTFATQPVKYAFSISNLGRINLTEINRSPRLKAIYGPIVNTSEQEMTVGISTYKGLLTMTLTYHGFVLKDNKADQIADLACELLCKAAS